MNEIERAIEFMFGQQALTEQAYLKNTDERIISRIDKVVAYYDLAIKALRAELSRQENAPMTWDELSAMIGKPVYIADLVDASESNWAIIGKAYSKLGLEFITLYDTIEGDVGCQELYGETWIAYRYEPKGESK